MASVNFYVSVRGTVADGTYVNVLLGRKRQIVAYMDDTGGVPALEFLDALEKKSKTRYMVRFQMFVDEGRLKGKYYHPLDAKKTKNKDVRHLAEFKDNTSQSRVLCFTDPLVGVVLTHGFGGKKESKLPEKEVLLALRIREDYLARKDEAVRGKLSRRGR